MVRIEMQGDAAQRRNDIAEPRDGTRPQRGGQRLQRTVELEVKRVAELGVHRRVADRREAQGLEELFQDACGCATPIMQSRVTIEASRSPLQPSVSAGRIGSTR